MITIPPRMLAMAELALTAIQDQDEQRELRRLCAVLSEAVWQKWLAWRPPEDNRQEHEWIVLANALRIADRENLSLSEKRIAVAFTFTHDTCFIPRITEAMIRAVQHNPAEAERLREGKSRQRLAHMEGSAKNAAFLLPSLNLLTSEEIARCVGIVAKHDLWKLRTPWPPSSDWLAVVCLEADALYPMHPLGVQADLERPTGEGVIQDIHDPNVWRKQLANSLQTLLEYRANWAGSEERFQDEESIFRTKEGARIFRGWRDYWRI